MRKLYLSHRLDLLAIALREQTLSDGRSPLATRTILVPNGALKQWLLLHLTSQSIAQGIAGYKILTLKEGLSSFILQENSLPSDVNIFFKVYKELSQFQDPDLLAYLNQNEKRLVELSDHLTSLFLLYGEYGGDMFEETPSQGWQKQLFQKIFVQGKWRLPIQIFPSIQSVPSIPLHCFGFDFLPSAILNFFSHFPSVSFYLFSPSMHYWDDLCTDRERKGWNKYWKKKGMGQEFREGWQEYWKEAPSLLANWGRLGRETIKLLDPFDLEIREDYTPHLGQKESCLTRLRSNLLEFSLCANDPKNQGLEDDSIQLFLTGSSRLREIENLREVILNWIEKEGLSPSDVSVFAPDIEVYAPFIEYVFTDIPYRIFGASLGSKSFFLAGLTRLFSLAEGDWDHEDLMTLFETPSFAKKKNWNNEIIEQFRDWLSQISMDRQGWEQLMTRFLYLTPSIKKPIEMSDADALEDLIETVVSLQVDLLPFRKNKMNLKSWADALEKLADQYLICDLTNEADVAGLNFFHKLIEDLKKTEEEYSDTEFPFAPIQKLLKQPLQGQIHSSQLNSIRFSSLRSGSVTPNQAIFLIGMDEESFPRSALPSSLDLLRKEKTYIPDTSDQDRYLFLQILFAALDFLFISYGHLSADEGKPVEASFLVQELLRSLDRDVKTTTIPPLASGSNPIRSLDWPAAYEKQLPEGEFIISVSDLSLLARHPWKFYLQKKFGIYFEEEKKESFSLCKAKLLRSSLKSSLEDLFKQDKEIVPPGICGEALMLDVIEKTVQRQALLHNWKLDEKPLFSLLLRESCREKKWIHAEQMEIPALDIFLNDHLKVRVVGEIKNLSDQGPIHLGDDTLGGILKIWPEYLISSIALSTRPLFLLKNGKIKAVDHPEAHLKAFILYYFYALSAPSPLMTSWADSILLKERADLEKKMKNSISGKGIRFEDPIFEWVMARAQVSSSEKIMENWEGILKTTFSGLIELYHSKEKNYA